VADVDSRQHDAAADPAVVVSVVYDGPPQAGKTTSVRALARSFGREIYTPEEQDGRTVHFDWLEGARGLQRGGVVVDDQDPGREGHRCSFTAGASPT
jgi:hypothetical protein